MFSPAVPEREYAELMGPSTAAAARADEEPIFEEDDILEEGDVLVDDELLEAELPALRSDAAPRTVPVASAPSPVLAAAPVARAPVAPAQAAAELPAEFRIMVVDDGTARLGVLAMRLNRIGATAIYASDSDEAMLFAAEPGAPIRALLVRANADANAVHLLLGRVAARSDRAPAILFVGDELAKPLLDLRSRCRIWSLREPLDDAVLREVTRSALYGTPHGAAQRQHPRVALDLLASVSIGDQSQAALLSSLSLHGAFLELAKRPPVGAGVDVSFQIEDAAIRAHATVLYHAGAAGGADGGIGVRFDPLASESAEAVEALIEQRSVRCFG